MPFFDFEHLPQGPEWNKHQWKMRREHKWSEHIHEDKVKVFSTHQDSFWSSRPFLHCRQFPRNQNSRLTEKHQQLMFLRMRTGSGIQIIQQYAHAQYPKGTWRRKPHCFLSLFHSFNLSLLVTAFCLHRSAGGWKWEWGQPLLIYLTKDWDKMRERGANGCHTDKESGSETDDLQCHSEKFHSITSHTIITYQLLSTSNSTRVTLIIIEHWQWSMDSFCECACVCCGWVVSWDSY